MGKAPKFEIVFPQPEAVCAGSGKATKNNEQAVSQAGHGGDVTPW
jgi:hypothetical protein